MGYYQENQINMQQKAKALLSELPYYCKDYYREIQRKSGTTVYMYFRHIKSFLSYIEKSNPEIQEKGIKKISLDDLEKLNLEDINEYIADELENVKDATVLNHLSALNSFFGYLYETDNLTRNIVAKKKRKDFNKGKKRYVVRLNDAQKKGFIDSVKYGVGLSDRQLLSHENLELGARDFAICITFLRTGIRVSELVGLNVEDIDFKEKCFYVIRKRAKKDVVYFDNDVSSALLDYLGDRVYPTTVGEPEPVFIVSQGKYKGERLSVRSVQRLVKKYAKAGAFGIGTQITPHKLRATYATDMLNATGNVMLVRNELAHENISTTQLYLDTDTQDRKKAAHILENLEKEE